MAQTMNFNFAVVDVETGGLDSLKNPMVEVAVIIMDNDLNIIGEYCELIKPYNPELVIQPQALAANNLTIEQIEGGKDASLVCDDLCAIFKKAAVKGRFGKPILCGHNSDNFDYFFFAEFFKFFGKSFDDYINTETTIDTMWWSRKAWQTSENYKLHSCCQNAGIELVNGHRALADTRVTAQLVKFFLERLRGKGIAAIEQPVKITPKFGF
jgi:DNA polymerase III alpha subunit (gram-positive type)